MKKNILAIASILTLSLTCMPSFAGYSSGTVSTMGGNTANLFLFKAGSNTSRPACATVDEWALNTNTTAGRALMALVITAQAQGKTVTVHGAHACDVWGDRESPVVIYVN